VVRPNIISNALVLLVLLLHHHRKLTSSTSCRCCYVWITSDSDAQNADVNGLVANSERKKRWTDVM
jgi:hypothetical protein